MATATAALAQVYKWVDERGMTHYGERPPQGSNASEVPNKLGSPAPEAATTQPKDQDPRPGESRTEKAEDRHKQDETRRRQQCDQQRDLLARLKQRSENSDAVARQEKLVAERCRG
jgi:hypothetical protein